METEKIFFLVLFILGMICCLISLVMLAILGRSRMKEVDEYVYGHKFEHDSIFFQIARVPQYLTVFSSRWFSKRTGQLDFYEHFDSKFKKPFLISFYLVVIGMLFLIVAVFFEKYYL